MLASEAIFPNEMSSLATARALVESQMAQIINLQPTTVNLSNVSYSGSIDTISGTSGSEADILNYAQLLRDTGGFTVLVSSINYTPTTDAAGNFVPFYNFTLNIN
jgi:hypothetical protein